MTSRDSAAGECVLTPFQRSLELARIYTADPVSPDPGNSPPPTLRVLSWNIGRGLEPERIAAEIARLRPHVACLQEVDWGNRRTGSSDVLRILAERTGMLGLFAIEFLELESRRRPAWLAGGGATANAILTRLRPAAAFRIDLPSVLDWQRDLDDPRLPRRVRRHLRREPRVGARCGLAAAFALGGRNVVVASRPSRGQGGRCVGAAGLSMAPCWTASRRDAAPPTSASGLRSRWRFCSQGDEENQLSEIIQQAIRGARARRN
jgi:hypothetical protein